jgi:hypothetical protein
VNATDAITKKMSELACRFGQSVPQPEKTGALCFY